MADRLISADKLKAHYAWWEGGTREMTMGEAKKDFDTIIDLQPTIEAEPKPSYPISEEYHKAYKEGYEDGYKEAKEVFEPKHGEWIGCTDGTVLCSRCLETNEPTNFCPNCGADMREVKGGKV